MLPYYSSNTTGPVSGATLFISVAEQWRAHQGNNLIDRMDAEEVLKLFPLDPPHRVPLPDEPGPLARRFHFLSDIEIEHLTPPSWQVESIIPNESLVELWGEPGIGKTFVALDIACCIASGRSWHGLTVKQGPVLYAAAEAQAGIGPRLAAWKDARGVAGSLPIWFPNRAPQLADEADVGAFVSALMMDLQEIPKLIVLDTLARCFLGREENGSKDMGLLVGAVDRIRRETRASIVLVHHSTKKGDTPRGHTILDGAMDTIIQGAGSGRALTLHCKKQKDFAPFENRRLRLVPHLESCILEETSEQGPSGTLGRRELDCLGVLLRLGAVRSTEWEKASHAAGVPESTFGRFRKALFEARLITKIGSLYEVSDAGRAWLQEGTNHSGHAGSH